MIKKYEIKQIDVVKYEGDVFNLELDSNSLKDDLYWIEQETGLVSHNCLPKDTKALVALVNKLNLDLKLFETIDKENAKFKPTVPEGMRNQ